MAEAGAAAIARDGPALHGWLIVDKPVGPGSTRIVSAVKRALREGGYATVKVGHGGTLDPLASGVLPIALGEATKLGGRMLDADKIYAFTIGFGLETDTLDLEGTAVATSAVRPTRGQVAGVLARFTGAIEQVPPVYSALKVDGARAYDRARAGETVTMAARTVTVRRLALAGAADPYPSLLPRGRETEPEALARLRGQGSGEDLDAVTLLATVSKGTYVRSLARDIARALGTVGHVAMLRRLKAGPFALDGAISLDRLAELGQARALETTLLPLAAGLDDIPALPVTPDQARLLRRGQRMTGIAAPAGLHLATDADVPVALVESDGDGLKVVRGFNL